METDSGGDMFYRRALVLGHQRFVEVAPRKPRR